MSFITRVGESFLQSIGALFGYGGTEETARSTSLYGKPKRAASETLRGYEPSPWSQIEDELEVSSLYTKEISLPREDERSWYTPLVNLIFSGRNLMGRFVDFVLGDKFKESAISDLTQATEVVRDEGIRGLNNPDLNWSWPAAQRQRVENNRPVINYIRETLTQIRDDATAKAREITHR